jgi:acyl dehydratase
VKYPEILSIRPEPVTVTYTDQDIMLYALGLGAGANPLDPRDLSFVYEENLRPLPTMSVLLGRGSEKILRGGGINFVLLLHGEQRLRIHKPLTPGGRVVSTARCLEALDKGTDKGAVLFLETEIVDAATGDRHATVISTFFCRGDGGFGGPAEGSLVPHPIPSRPPDKELALATRLDQAALYRLTGDRNPLHIDPNFAKRAGFEKPILHGLCTYGIACRAVMEAYCDRDPARIKSFDTRMSSPVYPGETIVTRMWKEGAIVSFECGVAERPVTVIKNGRAEIAE